MGRRDRPWIINGKLPRAALIITIERCCAQCSQAIMRAKLREPDAQVDRKSLPTFGKMLQVWQAEFDAGAFDGSYVGVPPDD
jgi:hypothetical protein